MSVDQKHVETYPINQSTVSRRYSGILSSLTVKVSGPDKENCFGSVRISLFTFYCNQHHSIVKSLNNIFHTRRSLVMYF